MLTLKDAKRILFEAKNEKSLGWVSHSVYVGRAASCMAQELGLDANRAMTFGYLHDIGRKFGDFKMNHAIYGYRYLIELGDEEAAGICLTHSFPIREIRSVLDYWDLTDEDYEFYREYLANRPYNMYDKIIQLADSMATGSGIVAMEVRMIDIMMRYGVRENTVPRFKALFALKAEIEQGMDKSIEELFGLKTLSTMGNVFGSDDNAFV